MNEPASCSSGCHRDDAVVFSDCGDSGGEDQVREISRVTWVGAAVNVGLAVVKIAGGILGRSNVLLADAAHTLSDLATDAAVLIGVRYWSAPADAGHPHGHHKIETLITMAIGAALAAVGLTLGWDATASLVAVVSEGGARPPETGAAGWLAFGAAMLSIVSKEILYRWTVIKGVRLGSSAVIANAWHHRSDAFSSIPPALALAGQRFGAGYGYNLWFLDPVGTLVVCVMLLQAAAAVVKPTLSALLDASADRKLCSAIRKVVLATPGVIDSHRIRTRLIGPDAVAVDLHIAVDKDLTVLEGHNIAARVKYAILSLDADVSSRAVDVLVHVEPAGPEWFGKSLPGDRRADTRIDWRGEGGGEGTGAE